MQIDAFVFGKKHVAYIIIRVKRQRYKKASAHAVN